MNFRENLRLAFSCVKSNKMRSILTMLGIIIGISAVITISTIGTIQTVKKRRSFWTRIWKDTERKCRRMPFTAIRALW